MIYRWRLHDQIYELRLEGNNKTFQAYLPEQESSVELLEQKPGQIDLRIDNRPVRVYCHAENGKIWISYQGCTYILEKPSYRSTRLKSDKSGEAVIRAPMPALVRSVEITEQALVNKGQTIMLLEAMKMEIRITAPNDGQVSHIYVESGQRVDQGKVLFDMIDASNKSQ